MKSLDLGGIAPTSNFMGFLHLDFRGEGSFDSYSSLDLPENRQKIPSEMLFLERFCGLWIEVGTPIFIRGNFFPAFSQLQDVD